MLTIAIMQPYFLPYIGYWQLINAVDMFIVYDNIKYTKKGWINRNRMLRGGKAVTFTLPLKKDSDSLDIRKRHLATSFTDDKHKLFRQFKTTYQNAPNFQEGINLVEECIFFEDDSLFPYILNSIKAICSYLEISKKIVVSSGISMNHEQKGQQRVIATCKAVGADRYINPIGGLDLYDKESFLVDGIDLKFLQSRPYHYAQLGNDFIPDLSIIDLIMFNDKSTVQSLISEVDFI